MESLLKALVSGELLFAVARYFLTLDLFDFRKRQDISFFSPVGVLILTVALFLYGLETQRAFVNHCSVDLSNIDTIATTCDSFFGVLAACFLIFGLVYGVIFLAGRKWPILGSSAAASVAEKAAALVIIGCVVLMILNHPLPFIAVSFWQLQIALTTPLVSVLPVQDSFSIAFVQHAPIAAIIVCGIAFANYQGRSVDDRSGYRQEAGLLVLVYFLALAVALSIIHLS